MKLALIGYGKMGQAIEEIACARGHEVVLRINQASAASLDMKALQQADACIEFTSPDAVVSHLMLCFDAGKPVVCGTTGWLLNWDVIKTYCEEKQGTLLYASNFSVGVQVFLRINQYAASLMKSVPGYELSMEEIHHTAKKDAPSGTAISLAEEILKAYPQKTGWVSGESADPAALQIRSRREDPAPGTHHVNYTSEVDCITLTHTAFNRKGFALGAVLAAEYIQHRKGIFQMKDVLGF